MAVLLTAAGLLLPGLSVGAQGTSDVPASDPPPATETPAPAADAAPAPPPGEDAAAVDGDAPDFPALLAALSAPAWPDRQAATERLMIDPAVTEAQLAAAWRDPATTLEARQRLDQALRHRIVAGFLEEFTTPNDPASLGITHPRDPIDALPQHAAPEIVVMSALPGFPAYPTLRPGDIMVRFNRQPFPAAAAPNEAPPVRDVIRGHRAGEVVTIHVVRDGEPLQLEIKLASSQALSVVYEGGPPTQLKPVYQQRLDARLHELLHADTEAASGAPAQPAQPVEVFADEAQRVRRAVLKAQTHPTDQPTPPDQPAQTDASAAP